MNSPPVTRFRHRLNRAQRSSAFAISRLLRLLALLLFLTQSERGFAADPLTLDEYQIKAGFLFNFTRFVSWPDKAFATATSPIAICVVGNSPLTAPLAEAAMGKVFDRRAVSVKPMKAGDDLRGCNLIFISSGEERHAVRILKSVKGMNVLTVGEDQSLMREGVIFVLHIQKNKIKLELNLDAAIRGDLKISAKLIAVSHIVSPSSAESGN